MFLLAERAKINHKEIKWGDYVEHYGAGSWTKEAEKMRKRTHIPVDEWLNKYHYLWGGLVISKQSAPAPEPEKPKPAPEEKVMPVEKKKEVEVKYLKMAKTSDRKIGVLNR